MALATGLHITFEIEPIVKLTCANDDCWHNRKPDEDSRTGWCNLKSLELDDYGHCINVDSKKLP